MFVLNLYFVHSTPVPPDGCIRHGPHHPPARPEHRAHGRRAADNILLKKIYFHVFQTVLSFFLLKILIKCMT